MKTMTNEQKIKLIENIKVVAKNKNINLGDLEEEVLDLSKGYFARLASDLKKDGNNRPLPPLDTFVLLCDHFNMPINRLIESDLSTLNERQGAVMNFIDSLTSDTNKGKFIWSKINQSKLSEEKLLTLEENPLYKTEVDEDALKNGYFDDPEEATFRRYKSKFVDCDENGISYYVEDDAFSFSYGKLTFLLIKVEYNVCRNGEWYHDNYSNHYELYSIKEGKFLPFAYASRSDTKDYFKCFDDLYEAARLSARVNPTGDDIIDMINDYVDYLKNREKFEKK